MFQQPQSVYTILAKDGRAFKVHSTAGVGFKNILVWNDVIADSSPPGPHCTGFTHGTNIDPVATAHQTLLGIRR